MTKLTTATPETAPGMATGALAPVDEAPLAVFAHAPGRVDTGLANCYSVRDMRIGGPATVAVTGAAGMLGQDVVAAAPGWATVVPLTRADGDLSKAEQAQAALLAGAPDVIVHCAAYTDVDGATRDPEQAWLGNALVTRHVAEAARRVNARLLCVSTDYVFDGTAARPYTERSAPRPLNSYGKSKLAGEREASRAPGSLIVRTQWLFGPGGHSFVRAILEAARAGRPLRVVEDEYGCPTYTPDLAAAIWRVLETPATGVVHLTNTGACSRLELAAAALDEAGLTDVEMTGIPGSEWPGPTLRPRNAVLASERLAELDLEPLRPWREALREYVAWLRKQW